MPSIKTTTPYCPYQNKKAKRENKTITKNMCSMLHARGLNLNTYGHD